MCVCKSQMSRVIIDFVRHKLCPVPFLPPSLLPALPFGIVMISLRARKSANFIQEMITFTNRQHTNTGKGVNFAAPGLQARQSVYSVLSALTSSSGPIVARQIPRNQHAIVRASYRNFKRANFVYLRSSLVPQKLARTLLLVSRTESYA